MGRWMVVLEALSGKVRGLLLRAQGLTCLFVTLWFQN